MPYSIIDGSRVRVPDSNRWRVTVHVDEVSNTGDYVAAATLGLQEIDEVIGAVSSEEEVAVSVAKNSQTLSATEDDPGDVFLQTASGTHDVWLTVRGRG